RRIVVRVVHVRARVRNRELVLVRLARFDRRLRQEWNAVLVVRNLQAVKVHARRFRQLVLQVDANAIALANPDLRAGDLIVVRPRLDIRPCSTSHWIFFAVMSKTLTLPSMRGTKS